MSDNLPASINAAEYTPPPGEELETLTPQERLFLDGYLQGMSAKAAAIQAGYSPNHDVAGIAGRAILKRPHVKAALKAAWDANTMSPAEVLSRLSEQARGSAASYLDVDESGYARLNLKKMSADGKLHLIKKIKYSDAGMPEIELYDAQAALVHLGKVYALFAERQIGGYGGGADVADPMSATNIRTQVNVILTDPSKLAMVLELAEGMSADNRRATIDTTAIASGENPKSAPGP